MSHKSIRRALEEMIYDQGMTPTGDENLESFTSSWDSHNVEILEKELSRLTKEELSDLCCGDRDKEMAAVLQRLEHAELVHAMLDDLFMTIN